MDKTDFLKKPLWKLWYDLAIKIDGNDFNLKFMNFGYATLDGDLQALELEKDDERHRYCIQLYHKTVEKVRVKGKHLLEMGCGRGGGASFIVHYLEPASYTGIDLSSEAIAANKIHYRIPNLVFHEGSADKIMTEDDSIDVVLTIESSHCYPCIQEFFREVRRILKPGGHFCYADFRKGEEIPAWIDHIHNSGLVLLEKEDITDHVLMALELDSECKLRLIKQKTPRVLWGTFEKFACVENSPNFNSLKGKRWRYFRFLLQKSDPSL